MTAAETKPPFVAIACGGTGGHLFPGIAVAGELKKRGCRVALLISPKEIDQQAVKTAKDFEVITLPAVGLQNRNYFSFAKSFLKSYLAAKKLFKANPPQAVLAMGGFTSAPPIFAAKKFRAKTFLHESNTIPGKANRYLARFVDEAFVGFPETIQRLRAKKSSATGTPVRPQFQLRNPEECRRALGLEASLPTILVVGGSQGASGLNEMILSALPLLLAKNWQWLHLAGAKDFEKVKQYYDKNALKAVVKPFMAEMDLALAASTACISRAGASSLAEIAAMKLPSLLVPFPAAADNHQLFNALAFEKSGAAKLIEQKNASPEKVATSLIELVESESLRLQIQHSLKRWHSPKSPEVIAEQILAAIAQVTKKAGSHAHSCKCGHAHRHAH